MKHFIIKNIETQQFWLAPGKGLTDFQKDAFIYDSNQYADYAIGFCNNKRVQLIDVSSPAELTEDDYTALCNSIHSLKQLEISDEVMDPILKIYQALQYRLLNNLPV